MLQTRSRIPLRRPALALAVAVSLAPAAARAGGAACWYEHGVVVAPAVVAGVAGDYILDTGAPATLLHETRAQTAGFEATALTGEIRFAGLTLRDRPIAVKDLDARTAAFPTPIAGIIGADVLAGRVLDISFRPCALDLRRPGAAAPFAARIRLAFRMDRGAPTVAAAVADGPTARQGRFVVATGADAAIRIDAAQAAVPGAADMAALHPDGRARARLRALSMGGDLFENLPGGLVATDGGERLGVIGAPVLARWRVRFDFAGGALMLAKAKGPPDRSEGP
jgi:hypothetical protein